MSGDPPEAQARDAPPPAPDSTASDAPEKGASTDGLTDAHHDWVHQFCGINPRDYESQAACTSDNSTSGGGASDSYDDPNGPSDSDTDPSREGDRGQEGGSQAGYDKPYEGGGGESGGGGSSDSYDDLNTPSDSDMDVDPVEEDNTPTQPLKACLPVEDAERQGYTEKSENTIQTRFKNRYGKEVKFVAKNAETGPCSKSSDYETGKHVQVLKGKSAVGAYFKCCCALSGGGTTMRFRVDSGL